ncbi:MAG: hypothetical protein IJN17_07505 [Clostridia bacterium]|nr:hypothetical protein [Oscillospiraceae bacterium]MBQ6702782.1 hypothetical protein [Clostridia bacterium]
MTILNAIEKFDAYRPNTIPLETKLDWLDTLEANLFLEVIYTHENPDGLSYSHILPDTDLNTELLVSPPFSDIYLHFLAMRYDLYFGDLARYNNDLLLYSSAFSDYAKHINKTHLPNKTTTCFNV